MFAELFKADFTSWRRVVLSTLSHFFSLSVDSVSNLRLEAATNGPRFINYQKAVEGEKYSRYVMFISSNSIIYLSRQRKSLQ